MQTRIKQESLQAPTSPFDEDAAIYDAAFSQTALGKCLRTMVWQRLDVAFRGCRRILEIGCGTGEDAIHLARRGQNVLATDASAAMLQVAKEKAQRAGCAQRIEFRRVPMERLGSELSEESFDGVFSNFGAVNCASRLDEVIAEIAPLLRADAPLIWVVMGRHVPWEWAWFLARGEWHKAFRRQRNGGVTWRDLHILYPTPNELARSLSLHFTPVRRSALGFVLPPTYASRWLENSPRLFAALTHIERVAQHWQPLAALADHYIMEARRLPAYTDA
ncbi:MAG: class I SAM-dependent methyltransferase [Woeseiaceae bacterium]